jgi:hypothetical protein
MERHSPLPSRSRSPFRFRFLSRLRSRSRSRSPFRSRSSARLRLGIPSEWAHRYGYSVPMPAFTRADQPDLRLAGASRAV